MSPTTRSSPPNAEAPPASPDFHERGELLIARPRLASLPVVDRLRGDVDQRAEVLRRKAQALALRSDGAGGPPDIAAQCGLGVLARTPEPAALLGLQELDLATLLVNRALELRDVAVVLHDGRAHGHGLGLGLLTGQASDLGFEGGGKGNRKAVDRLVLWLRRLSTDDLFPDLGRVFARPIEGRIRWKLKHLHAELVKLETACAADLGLNRLPRKLSN